MDEFWSRNLHLATKDAETSAIRLIIEFTSGSVKALIFEFAFGYSFIPEVVLADISLMVTVESFSILHWH